MRSEPSSACSSFFSTARYLIVALFLTCVYVNDPLAVLVACRLVYCHGFVIDGDEDGVPFPEDEEDSDEDATDYVVVFIPARLEKASSPSGKNHWRKRDSTPNGLQLRDFVLKICNNVLYVRLQPKAWPGSHKKVVRETNFAQDKLEVYTDVVFKRIGWKDDLYAAKDKLTVPKAKMTARSERAKSCRGPAKAFRMLHGRARRVEHDLIACGTARVGRCHLFHTLKLPAVLSRRHQGVAT